MKYLLFLVLLLIGCDSLDKIDAKLDSHAEQINYNKRTIMDLEDTIYTLKSIACEGTYEDIEVGTIVYNDDRAKRIIVLLPNKKYTLVSIDSDKDDNNINIGEVDSLYAISTYMRNNSYKKPRKNHYRCN